MTPVERFRYLSRTPRPSEPLDLEREWLRGAVAVALSPQERADIEGLDDSARAAHRIAATCWVGGAPLFSAPGDTEELEAAEFDALDRAIVRALRKCCPMYSVSLTRELERAALDSANVRVADMMFTSQDVVVGLGGIAFVERPERYYGVPTCRITDGQLMCYRAACRALSQHKSQKT